MIRILNPQQMVDLAAEHHRARRLPEAEALYRQLLTLFPGNIDVLHSLALVIYESGRHPEAFSLFHQCIQAAPHVAEFHNNFGLLLSNSGRLDEAAVALETACHLAPAAPQMHYNLGNTRQRQGQTEAAITAYRTALGLDRTHALSWLNWGIALDSEKRHEEALTVCREGLRHCPGDLRLLTNLAALLQDAGHLNEALEVLQAARAVAPGEPIVLNNLAMLHKERGEIPEAVPLLRQSIIDTPNSTFHSNLIFTLYLDSSGTLGHHPTEHLRWNTAFSAGSCETRSPYANDRSPERRLRIGYVSADLRDHVVGRTLLPIFEAHDAAQVECICYAGESVDAVTERFRARAAGWRQMDGLNDNDLVDMIRGDGIDILVDLGLHTAGNRLPAFARKPAPVQISWLGYPETSGLWSIDYWLADRFLVPADNQPKQTFGKPFRLPDAWCCYPAPSDSPAVGDLPFIQTGHITFGSFNNFAKINSRVLALWMRILNTVRQSRLLLLGKTGSHREQVRSIAAQHGIASERIEFVDYSIDSPQVTVGNYLQRYNRVDIALDPFPYNGMTTTGDALWMGVPVIALCGTTGMSRASFSLLSNIGLGDLVAQSEDAYLALAISLAGDRDRLLQLRATLRERMQRSPLLDPPRFARHLEAAYREMWREWCRGAT